MWLEYLIIARKVLFAHKFRSLLTVLSITIGAFSIVLMSSLAQSGSTTLFRSIEELGGGLGAGPGHHQPRDDQR